MRIVAFSDTHGQHAKAEIPDGDVLVFAGDHCYFGEPADISKFCEWSASLPHKHKLFVAGNHDRPYEQSYDAMEQIARVGWFYLENSGKHIDGVNFYGSPYQPIFCNWAFNKKPEYLKECWANIPEITNVLITHCPPYGILDFLPDMQHVGCALLRERLENLVNLKLHIFGHIHNARGVHIKHYAKGQDVKFANVALCDEDYNLAYKPMVFNI